MNPLGDAAAAAGVGLTVWRRVPESGFQLVDSNHEARRLLGAGLKLSLPSPLLLLLEDASTGRPTAAVTAMLPGPDGLGVLAVARAGRLVTGDIGLSFQAASDALPGALATLDPVSGSSQRGHLLDAITTWLEQGPVAVAALNLIRFRDVNSTLGHRHGDVLLRLVASRLAAVIGPRGVVARLGADQFVVACRDDALHSDIGERLARSFHAPFLLGGSLPVRVSAGVGVAQGPADGDTAESLMQRADIALGVAERQGVTVARYDHSADRTHVRRLRLLNDLQSAIGRRELALHYQPKVSAISRQLQGAEGLLRWNHSELGSVSPMEFVPIAEESGLIRSLTSWVLAEMGRHWRTLANRGILTSLSANISATNLYDPRLAKWLQRAIDGSNISRGGLTLELTETQMAGDLPMAGTILRRLQATGAKLSLDDFGTGYSSLSYLSKLPFDEVKIDRSFVQDLDAGQDNRVITTIIGLGHNLGLSVVAEGVENEQTLTTLAAMGCDQIQGHHVSKALPFEDFAEWATTSASA